MKKHFWLNTLLLGAFCLASYQNCTKGKFLVDLQQDSELNSQGTQPGPVTESERQVLLRITQPQLINNCFQDPDYNACIFWKNPVAQQNSPLSPALNRASNLSAIQIHAVNITPSSSGLLENTSFTVVAGNADGEPAFDRALADANGDFNFVFQGDPQHYVGQVMAYYWLNAQVEFMEVWTGVFYGKDRGIDVNTHYPDLVNAYWSPDPVNPEVVLGVTTEGNEFALNADVYLHEMGHANLTYGSNRNIHNTAGGSDTNCNGSGGVCCADINGCSWAINEGQADYHAAIIFESNTALGETFVNSVDGLPACGIPRTVDVNSALTAQQAYDSCGGDFVGEVHVTGIVYSSIWWEVRKAAIAIYGDQGKKDVDVLFSEHLRVLNGRDDFVSAYTKIESLDASMYGGKYTAAFKAEYGRVGLTVD